MSFREVYINKTAHFLPNEPVSNEEMEAYLGMINGKSSRSKNIVLRNNGIKQRFYALQKGGISTHSNAELTALAVKELFKDNPSAIQTIQLLTCGTSSPDQMMPSHGVMVHGWLPEAGAIDVITPSGNCCSGMLGLKYAFMAIRTGEVNKAVSTGSERTSKSLCASTFEDEAKYHAELEQNPYIAFEKDFLRWMLSDGAGAFLLSDKKNDTGLSLKIEWIESGSYAHLVETCMYQASEKTADGKLKGYAEFTAEEIMHNSILAMKQDVKLLDKNIVELGMVKLRDVVNKTGLDVNTVDYFLPHLSSEFFRKKIADKLDENNMSIPQEKWFTNLTKVGNVGAGSIFLMIDELFNSGTLQKGQKLLLMVPESSRFSYVYSLLTVC